MSKNLHDILRIAHKANVNPALLGRHGIGKTAMIKALESDGYGVVTLIASQLDPTTVGGFPTKVPLEDGGYKMIYAVPDFILKLHEIAESGRKPVLFLDEFNRGDRYVENAFMTLVLDKEINGHKLPEGTFVVAAMNPEADDDLGVSELTAPMMDRFAWVFVEPDANEWLGWAKVAGVNVHVRNFIQKEKSALTGFPLTDEMKDNYLSKIKPTPRSWDAVGRILDAITTPEGSIDRSLKAPAFELIRGLVGTEMAVALEASIKDEDLRKFTVEEMLSGSDEVIERLHSLVDNNKTQVVIASLEDFFEAIPSLAEGKEIDDFAAEIGNPSEGFGRFLDNLPVDILMTFYDLASSSGDASRILLMVLTNRNFSSDLTNKVV